VKAKGSKVLLNKEANKESFCIHLLI